MAEHYSTLNRNLTFLIQNLRCSRSMEVVLAVSVRAEETLDSGHLKATRENKLVFPPSLSASQPLSLNPYASVQQVFSVCSGITVCDFSLTSQAALWHRGVIVSSGWKPFCHGRAEKDKAAPQPPRLAECSVLVSPAR